MRTKNQLIKDTPIEIIYHNIIEVHVINENKNASGSSLRAEIIKDKKDEIFKKYPNKNFDVIINLSKTGEDGEISDKARKIYVEIAKDKRLRNFAIVGGGYFLKTIVYFVGNVALKGK